MLCQILLIFRLEGGLGFLLEPQMLLFCFLELSFLLFLGRLNPLLRKGLFFLGCCPPSNVSGDSSITNLWMSTISFDNVLNGPFHWHEHLLGSLNFLSTCKTAKIAPQFGHSNLAFATCGLTSDACLTIPSIHMIWSRCFALMSLIFVCELFGRSMNLNLGDFTSPDSSRAFSIIAIVSSGNSITLSDSIGENSANCMNWVWTTFSPSLIDSPIFFLYESKKFFASIVRASCLFFSKFLYGATRVLL